MNHAAQPPAIPPYLRAHRVQSEPVLFAVGLVAMVMAISLWHPLPEAQQAVPASQPTTVAELPRA